MFRALSAGVWEVLGRPRPSMVGGRSYVGEQIDELKKRVEEQAKALDSLASSIEGENRFGELLSRVKKPI